MSWRSQLSSQEKMGKNYLCTYTLHKNTYPDLCFLCEVQISERLDLLNTFPSRINGEIIQLPFLEIREEINELKKKIHHDFEREASKFVSINESRSTVSVICKMGKRSRVPLQDQIIENPLSSKTHSQTSLTKSFQRLVNFLDQLLPYMQKFFTYFGIANIIPKAVTKTAEKEEMDAQSNKSTLNIQQEDQRVREKFQRQSQLHKLQVELSKIVKDVLDKNLGYEHKFNEWKKILISSNEDDIEEIENEALGKQLKQVYQATQTRVTGEGCGNEKNTYEIEVINKQMEEQESSKQIGGGVCKIEKKTIRCSSKDGGFQDQELTVARKTVKKNTGNPDADENTLIRFRREIDIVKFINSQKGNGGKKNYLLNYYYDPQDQQTYYVEWIDLNLAQYLIFQRPYLTFDLLLDICAQIIYIVKDLHQSRVVHRDLKLSNFMVVIDQGRPIIKLIDFSDSMRVLPKEENPDMDQNGHMKFKIYCTGLYSPLECHLVNKKFLEKGIINHEIDYWSVGIIVYEIIHGNVPFSYSVPFYKDIHTQWEKEMLSLLNRRKKRGLKKIFEVIEMITVLMVNTKQEERMGLEQALFLILACKFYLRRLSEICFNGQDDESL